MGIDFEIQYEENPHGLFFTGQVVRGRAIVKVDERVLVKGVKLRVRGFAKVRWTETTRKTNSDGSSSTTSDVHRDEIEYFDSITNCNENKMLEYYLEPGVHTFNFECLLPIDCPSSFRGTYGRIHYESKITLVRPRKFNKSYSMGFNVVKVVDLNPLSHLMIPAKMEVFKTFCCWPCKSKPLVLSMDIPQTGYAPGEFVHVNARLVNHSSTEVEQLKIAINLIALYRVRRRIKTKTEKIAIAKRKFSLLDGLEDFLVVKEKLQVPPTPPTCEDLCEILKITYEVEVIAKVRGAHISPVVSIPITIGNIPFVARSAHISEDNLIANLRNGITPGRQISVDDELPPPTYEEAIFMQQFNCAATAPRKDDEDADDDTECGTYLPRYPFYSAQFPYLAMQERP